MITEIIHRHKSSIIDEGIDPKVIQSEDVLSLIEAKQIKQSDGLENLKKQAQQELNELIGLENIKQSFLTWNNSVTIEKKR
ncbi:hypothetical protein [Priestia filamentosa]|uniref:hypothetical protein n=1 Tax=Priestia filamentosa TaxID=1402861 RepID=UPI0039825F5F